MKSLTAKTGRCDGDDHCKCDCDRPRVAEGEAVNMLPSALPYATTPFNPWGKVCTMLSSSIVTSLLLIPIIHSTLTDLLVRQASSLTTGAEQNQCWQSRNELQARNAIVPFLYPAPGEHACSHTYGEETATISYLPPS